MSSTAPPKKLFPDSFRPTHAPRVSRGGCVLLALVLAACGCRAIRPTGADVWSPDQAILSQADIQGDQITVHNIRNCEYRTTDDYTVRYYDKTFDLRQLKTVDFIMVPFPEMPSLAHTMLSFGFDNRDYLAVSVEVRRQKGETYDPVKGLVPHFELMYVLGDERDLIGLRANHRLNDVYLYHGKSTPDQARRLFVDVMQRVNKLHDQPEYYNTLTNNCTTNLARHINDISPNRIRYDYRVLLPGYSDRLAYELGLIDTALPFAQAREQARVNKVAYVYRDSPAFSQSIRR
ncbi:MAG: DUF4105 domain-containing protein [Planctomycetia bacterium]|nr:DUF4105 domain-containing protein [Planctomycetia bacterium]